MVTIQDIIGRAKEYLPTLNTERVTRAFQFADEAHRGQARFSGEPYIIHPLEVTNILLDFHPDENSIITALLHDVAEDTSRTLDDIQNAFGEEVRTLCAGLQKLSKVRSKINDQQIENLRKLFLAMAKDFRVVLIKLCDRLHNMRTLEFVRPEKRARIAQETINVYAPIAARLGIYRLKSQLEDLCFKYLYTADYDNLFEQISKTSKGREKYIESAQKILLDILSQEGIQANIDGRVKSLYSIHRKLKRKNKTTIDEIFDVFAMRIILPDIYKYGKEYSGHIYTALGVLHSNFTPLANRFKDYVAVPKVNGYRSLHTTVMGLGPKIYAQPTEVQIRTEAMHHWAEFGIAAHWIYEEGASSDFEESLERGYRNIPRTITEAVATQTVAPLMQQHKEWISGLGKIEQEMKSNQELLENLKEDVFQDRIFVLTPRGDVKDLPVGATPIDFAYSVHSEIGNRCVGAKINGNMAPVDHELKSGEVVEIITRKNAHPNQHWLSFVKTTQARNRIRAWFRNLDEDKHLRDGRELLNEKLRQFGRPPLDENLTLLKHVDGKNLNMNDRKNLLVEVGKGAVMASTLVRKLFSMEELLMHRLPKSPKPRLGGAKKEDHQHLIIGNEKNLPYHFVKCCEANFSDDLVGYVTRGRGVSVHRKNCPVLKGTKDARLLSVHLSGTVPRYPVSIRVEVEDRVGMMRDLSKAIADASVNIIDVSQDPAKNGHAQVYFVLEVEKFDQLDSVLEMLEKIPSVRRACTMN